ncbi:MAG TPA: tetratricopeptide repeat protein [Candidatus Aquilonibacter sp.]|nr:tetratricopeptide repeat protein [Candidatus Aquilonibacter sp.]
MRSSIQLIAALLLFIVSSRTFAQYAEIDPRTLPAQISAQQLIVQAAPGNLDWHAWLKLAVLLQDAGSYRASENAYRRAIALLRAPDPLTVADIFDHMGTMYVASGQLSNAEPLERHALAIREHQHDILGTGVSHMHLAMLLLNRHDLQSAEAEAQSAVHLLVPESVHRAAAASSSTPSENATPEEKMTALIDLALVKCASGAASTALTNLRSALQIAHETYPGNSIPVGYIEFLLGYASWKGGNSNDANILMSKGIDTLALAIDWGQPAYLGALRQYRAFLVDTRQTIEAQRVSAEIARLDRSAAPPSQVAALQNPPK